jgi:glutathione S-transferase
MADARLAKTDYLGGAAPCFADIIFGTLLYRYFTLDFERRKTPNLDAHYARLTRRPAYAEHVMVSYESLRWKP